MPQDLWKIRKQKGLSVAQLAAKTGVSIALIQEYESGAREIPSSDLRRLARALYVGEWEINPRSTPPPTPAPAPAKPPAEEKPPTAKPRSPRPPDKPRPPRPPDKPRPPRPVEPPRESQITHMLGLAKRLGLDRAALEEEIGKPLDQLTLPEARRWNRTLAERITRDRPPRQQFERKHATLPEGVDGFEAAYLEKAKADGCPLFITLFNNERYTGALVGYGPYTLTIRQDDGSELTINKLAIAHYRRTGGAA